MNSPVVNWRKTKQLNKHLNKKGKLLVWTKIYAAPAGFEHEAPYFSGIVEFEDGQKSAVQIVDVKEEDLKVGLEVISVVRKIGSQSQESIIDYGIKMKPV